MTVVLDIGELLGASRNSSAQPSYGDNRPGRGAKNAKGQVMAIPSGRCMDGTTLFVLCVSHKNLAATVASGAALGWRTSQKALVTGCC